MRAIWMTLLLAACATPQNNPYDPGHWAGDPAAVQRGMAVCRMRQAELPDQQSGKLGNIAVGMEYFENCMVAQGFTHY